MPFRPIDGRTAYDINLENQQHERARRQALALSGAPPQTVVLPQWDAFFGGLDRAQEDAEDNGMGFRLNYSGFGDGMDRSRASLAGSMLMPDRLINGRSRGVTREDAQAFQLGEARLRDANASADLRQTAAQEADLSQQDQEALDRAMTQGASRDQILAAVPGHMRPSVQAFFDSTDARKAALEQEKAKTAAIPIEANAKMIQAQGGGVRMSDVQDSVRGMMDGSIPPQLPGRASKEYTAILGEAKRQGYDLSRAVIDWNATQKHVASLNGAQQLRLNQAINQLPELLDSVESLATQWKGGQFPILNKANLAAAKGGAYGPDAASIATRLEAQIADVNGDLGAVYMGGNSPTDHALQLASKALNSDWDEKVMRDAIAQARENVRYRRNSINNTGVAGASANNPYASPAPAVAQPAAVEEWVKDPKTGKYVKKGAA